MSEASDETGAGRGEREEWHRPRPAELPRPTVWPSVLAAAVCFALWGVLTSPWMIVVGMAGGALAVGGWIGDLRHEPQD